VTQLCYRQSSWIGPISQNRQNEHIPDWQYWPLLTVPTESADFCRLTTSSIMLDQTNTRPTNHICTPAPLHPSNVLQCPITIRPIEQIAWQKKSANFVSVVCHELKARAHRSVCSLSQGVIHVRESGQWKSETHRQRARSAMCDKSVYSAISAGNELSHSR